MAPLSLGFPSYDVGLGGVKGARGIVGYFWPQMPPPKTRGHWDKLSVRGQCAGLEVVRNKGALREAGGPGLTLASFFSGKI